MWAVNRHAVDVTRTLRTMSDYTTLYTHDHERDDDTGTLRVTVRDRETDCYWRLTWHNVDDCGDVVGIAADVAEVMTDNVDRWIRYPVWLVPTHVAEYAAHDSEENW